MWIPRELELMGVWIADAANEAATDIEATVFLAPGTWTARPSAEIAEIRWLDLAELTGNLNGVRRCPRTSPRC